MLQNLSFNDLHHAYLIKGSPSDIAPKIISFLEQNGVQSAQNPDVRIEFFETFGIDDSRRLKINQLQKSVTENSAGEASKKFFILGINFFTREAENSLLKVFEEPASNTYFFIITPNPHLILPTLRSRLISLDLATDYLPKAELADWARKFLSQNKSERILEIEKIISESKDLPAQAGDKEGESLRTKALDILDAIIYLLYKDNSDEQKIKLNAIFEEIGKCRSYLSDRGASVKMLLEHMALILPKN